MNLIGSRIAVVPLADPDTTPGGIIIPEIAKQRIDQGIVAFVGPDVRDIKLNDHVCFSGYTGLKVALQDEGEFYILEEEEVVAVLEDSPEFLFTSRMLRALWNPDLAVLEDRLRMHFWSKGLEY